MQRRSFATRPGDEPASKPAPQVSASLIPVLLLASAKSRFWIMAAPSRRLERFVELETKESEAFGITGPSQRRDWCSLRAKYPDLRAARAARASRRNVYPR